MSPISNPEPPPPRRADARRNRDLLLAAAGEVFAERGVDAPLDEIARRAGVGNATMYRHFPTRRELIVAAYSDEVADLCRRGEELLDAPSPADALFDWLALLLVHIADKRALASSIRDEGGGGEPRTALLDRWHDAMRSTAAALLTRAQNAGAAGPDVEPADLLTQVHGIALAAAGPAQTARLMALLRRAVEPR